MYKDTKCLITEKYYTHPLESCLYCNYWNKCWTRYNKEDIKTLYSKEATGIMEKIEKEKKENDVRSYNVGNSDYSKHKIQPWDIWKEYHLNPWDADIIKRVLRTKEGEDRKMDYEKIIHICKERINQLNDNYEF